MTSRAALARPAGDAQARAARAPAGATAPSTCSAASPPSAGARRAAAQRAPRVFCSPGPIYEPEGRGADYWRMGRALFAAGFRAGDLAHNAFSYHFTPAGAMMDCGAHAVGCTVFPGRHRPDRAAGPGDRRPAARRLCRHAELPEADPLEKADETGIALPSLKKASVGGEAFPAGAARLARGARHRRPTRATAPPTSASSPTRPRRARAWSLDEGVIVEIVRPGTGDPVADGEVGEVVVTTLQSRLPADPLRHRRPVGGAARAAARPAAPTRASAAGSAAPTRRPRCAACSCIRARSPRSCAGTRR